MLFDNFRLPKKKIGFLVLLLILIYILIYFNYNYWGLGIGDWGFGIGPNPQSPISNQVEKTNILIIIKLLILFNIQIQNEI